MDKYTILYNYYTCTSNMSKVQVHVIINTKMYYSNNKYRSTLCTCTCQVQVHVYLSTVTTSTGSTLCTCTCQVQVHMYMYLCKFSVHKCT